MKHRNESGNATPLLPICISAIVLLVFVSIFAIWAFQGRQKYKNNVNALVSAAVTSAKNQQSATDAQQYALASENPLLTYQGPQEYGSIVLQYPRNWSSYVNTSGNSESNNAVVDGYFYPVTLTSVATTGASYALRMQVVNQPYANVLSSFQNNNSQSAPVITAYSFPKIPQSVGVKVVGMLPDGNLGTLIIMPVRNQTIELWTDGSQFINEFDNDILKNFSFSP